jgi:hypothetical protein
MIKLKIIFLFLAPFLLQAQQKVMGMPEKFKSPEDRFDIKQNYLNYINESGKKINENYPWLVLSDRAQNPIYSRENVGSTIEGYMDFKDVAYVLDETTDWIKVAVGATVDRKTYNIIKQPRLIGWVKKTDVVLWQNTLKDSKTGIHRKVFLLNNDDNIDYLLKQLHPEIVEIYSSPLGETKEPDLKIYSFYFLLKKENDRFLLAKNVSYNITNAQFEIIGWVKKGKCTVWNTRIALEPNFENEAFQERKRNKHNTYCFRSLEAAEVYSHSGIPNTNDIILDRDPMNAAYNDLAKTNNKRYPGTVVRYPLLTKHQHAYRSGVIGDIHVKVNNSNQLEILAETSFSNISEKAKELDEKAKNINILFAIEGTQQVSTLKNTILNAISSAENTFKGLNKMRLGAAIYRDEYEADMKRDVELIKLTNNIEEFKNKMSNIIFDDVRSQESDYTCMHFALKKAIDQVGFDPKETNIIIVIGEKADFSVTKRRTMDPSNIRLITVADLQESLKAISAHVFFIQLNSENFTSNKFRIDAKNILIETAKAQYNDYRNLENEIPGVINILTPDPDESDANNVKIKYAPTVMRQSIPVSGLIGERELKTNIEQFTEACQKLVVNIESKVTNNSLVKGAKLENSSGEFSGAMAKRLNDILKSRKATNGEMVKAFADKYQLYTNVYLPIKCDKSTYPLFSYVLYMPESDLKSYMDDLRKCMSAMQDAPDNKREKLYAAILSLMQRVSGNTELPEDITANDLFNYMNGIQKEGLSLTDEKSFYLKDIMNERKVKDTEIDEFLNRISSKYAKLQEIKSQGKRYEFSYVTSTEDLYYWIAVDDAF